MNYRVLAVGGIVGLLLACAAFTMVDLPVYRYEQHKQDIQESDLPEKESSTVTAEEDFVTHLPLLVIETQEEIPESKYWDETAEEWLPNKAVVRGSLKYIQNEEGGNHTDDTPVFETNLLIRTRGRSSRSFDKKGYWMEFQDETFQQVRDIEIDGMVADSDWVLHGPYLDKSLVRNYLCYNLAGKMGLCSPNVRFCEVYINGSYEGLYVLTEKIKYNDEGRINIEETEPKAASTSYIVQMDAGTTDPLRSIKGFLLTSGKVVSKEASHLEIIYPNRTLTTEQRDFIQSELALIEKTITSYDLQDSQNGYKKLLDVDDFVDYFILNEFTMNQDAMSLSTYLYRDLQGRLQLAVWDFNNTFNNYENEISYSAFLLTEQGWFPYLLRDHTFVELIIQRYQELRKGILSEEALLESIDEITAYLGSAANRNNERWSSAYDFIYLLPIERNTKSYEEAIKQLKEAIISRGNFLDEHIESLRYYSHASINKQYRKTGGAE